ncbi:MAG: PaaX family transcriptional regulator [Pseudomonadota bacterium]|nr:PaaX family transcriptional regulator [Pseudomonadota bacterium]
MLKIRFSPGPSVTDAQSPSPKHLILNLLLAANGETMSARDAINACALFGIRENSVRVALVRLSAESLIEAAGRGAYRFGPKATGLADDVRHWRDSEQRLCEWSQHWLAVHLGGLGRSDRSRVRARDRALAMTGLRELDPGLYIRPDNLRGGVEALRERLLRLGLDEDAPAFIAHAFDAAREQRARRLWDTKRLDKSYRSLRNRLEKWLANADELEPDVAAREAYLLGHEAIRSLVYDPLLPAPLVDVEARKAFIAVVQRFDHAGHLIWQHQRPMPSYASRTTTRGTRIN